MPTSEAYTCFTLPLPLSWRLYPESCPRRGCLAPNWVLILEQTIDERTLNSVFWVSVKTTLFAVLSEKLPLFTALLSLTTLNTEYFFPLRPEKLTLFYKLYFFYPKRWQRCALPSSKKGTLSHRVFCSRIGTKLACKHPIRESCLATWSLVFSDSLNWCGFVFSNGVGTLFKYHKFRYWQYHNLVDIQHIIKTDSTNCLSVFLLLPLGVRAWMRFVIVTFPVFFFKRILQSLTIHCDGLLIIGISRCWLVLYLSLFRADLRP